MGMRRKVLKGIGYATAPRLTFAALNPRKAAFAKATEWAVNRVAPGRKRRSQRNRTMTGLGAAAVAVPLGFWLGRRFWSSNEPHAEMRGMA
jgi:hypothetical protein